jgi:hypothetical protein
MTRKVTAADIRTDGPRILAGPAWAYLETKHPRGWSTWEPDPEAWADVLAVQKAKVESHYQAEMRTHVEFVNQLLQSAEGRAAVRFLHHPVRSEVSPPSAGRARRCPVCGGAFYSFYGRRRRYCSDNCFGEGWRRKPRKSRARPRARAACRHCGAVFRQTRKDARYCSARCRVAHHRKEREDEAPAEAADVGAGG